MWQAKPTLASFPCRPKPGNVAEPGMVTSPGCMLEYRDGVQSRKGLLEPQPGGKDSGLAAKKREERKKD